MKVVSEKTFEDGSCWNAVVELGGILYTASYVAGRITSGMVSYKQRIRAPRWHAKSVQTWAEKRVADLGPEFAAKHAAVYGLA